SVWKHAALLVGLYQAPRATLGTPRARAPARRSARQHSAAVAPVVRASSTTTTWRPATLALATKASRTLARRSSAPRSLWLAVARTRASQPGFARRPSVAARRSVIS